jgi:hypothetical protein
LSNAEAHGANCLVVACPMCHVNLDMKQPDIERRYGVRHVMPVYYLSDVVGLALGFKPEALGINRHFVCSADLQVGTRHADLKVGATKKDAGLKAGATKKDAGLKTGATKKDAGLKAGATGKA